MYQSDSFAFTVVLGDAVLLRFGTYDESLAGVSRDVLRQRTLETIAHYAAVNRWVDPKGTWGGSVYWDATFESYFAAAARLMCDDLDPATRTNVDAMVRGAANNVVSLGTGTDPRAPKWTTNGLDGGYRTDTKEEEMGARTMPLAAALASLPEDPSAPVWREWLTRWTTNIGGLPPADRADPAMIDGRPVSQWNQAQNIYGTFAAENHGSFSPIYQESAEAYPGRNIAQYLIAGAPVPQSQRALPNGAELSRTLLRLATDSGVAAYPMVADRYHLYGREVLPVAYRAVVGGDPDAARAERMLLDHLEPYLHYAPEWRLTKFSAESQGAYEPEARSELAMDYLLYYGRAGLGGGASPVSRDTFFKDTSSVTDYGSDVGLLAQQSPDALAAAVTKPGFAKFAWLPEHDDWLFDPSAANPSFLPSTSLSASARTAHVYRAVRDGTDASATLLRTSAGYAGFTTLPDGSAVYATTGLASDEGASRVFALNMPGVHGLDGDRTFTGSSGAVTLAPGNGDGGGDEVTFPTTNARYVRMLGVRPATSYGYSLWDFEAYGDGGDLARGRPATASSGSTGYEPVKATDGSASTRWAVSTAGRGRADSWLAVDLGASQPLSRVRLDWETAYGAAYRIQVSGDGSAWRDVANVSPAEHEFTGHWLNVDGEAGSVIRGGTNPIRATPAGIVLSDGPASGSAGLVVGARPGQTPDATAQSAGDAAPTGGPATLRAALDGGHLSLFNLSGTKVTGAQLKVPMSGDVRLYRGSQRTTPGSSTYQVTLAAADARVEPPRFVLSAAGTAVPPLDATVTDSRTVTLTNLAASGTASFTVRAADGSDSAGVTLAAGARQTVRLTGPRLTPVADLALTKTTFPTSPLPPGMSDTDLAVDGDPATAWRPGPGGRMVIDLGARYALDRATLSWRVGRVTPAVISVSDDGLTYREIATAAGRGDESLGLGGAAGRYLAIQAPRWEGNTGLSEIGLFTENCGRSGKPMFFGWCGVVGTSSLFVTEVGGEAITVIVGLRGRG
ncbi:MAG: discoidin domain-containing protein [Actinoallomurus sp.]